MHNTLGHASAIVPFGFANGMLTAMTVGYSVPVIIGSEPCPSSLPGISVVQLGDCLNPILLDHCQQPQRRAVRFLYAALPIRNQVLAYIQVTRKNRLG